MRLHGQQKAMLQALIERSPQHTKELARIRYDGSRAIRDPARVARRLEARGLVKGQRAVGLTYWSITDAGLDAMGWTR